MEDPLREILVLMDHRPWNNPSLLLRPHQTARRRQMPSHLMMFPTVPSPSLSPYPFDLELWTDLRFPFLAYCCPHGISRPLLAETARWVERSLAASVAT